MLTMAQWEDETCNRQVQFSVEYSIKNGALVIDSVTPSKVTFIDAQSNTALNSIGVHTEKGRKMLADQFAASGKLDELAIELGRRNGLLVFSS